MFGLFQGEAGTSGGEVVGRLIARKRYGRAAAALRRQIARSPDSVPLRLRLAEVLLLEDRSGDALSVLQELAEELLAAGAVDKAEVVLRKILRIVPAHPVYRASLDRLLQGPRPEGSRGGSPRLERAPPGAPDRGGRPAGEPRRPASRWTVPELRTLRGAPVFAGMTRHALLQLTAELGVRSFEPGAEIVTEGEPGDSLWVLASGRVRVEVEPAHPSAGASGRAPVRTLAPGDHFGEISALTGQPRTATVVAVSACRLLELDAGRLEGLTKRHPRMAAVLRRSCRRRALSAEEVAARGGIDALL